MGKLAEAIRAKFSTPREALRALGLDENLLDEEQEMGNQFNKAAYNQAYSAALTAAKKMIALDEETESSGNIEERLRRLESLFEDLMSADALHRFGGGRDEDLYEDLGKSAENGWIPTGDRRRGARDMPPDFMGRPRGGAADPAVMREREEYDRKVNDRKLKGFGAHDAALGLKRPHSTPAETRSFYAMFPEAKRILIG